jgi:two-component system response regulator GlrR
MSAKQLRLVLIDDDPGVLRALGLVLSAMQYSVTSFSSPNEALSYLKGRPEVDLVVTDLRMPELSGAELLDEIRRFTANLPVIVMSGHAAASEVQDLNRKGADGFIPKPFSPQQLVSAVHKAMARRKDEYHPGCTPRATGTQ